MKIHEIYIHSFHDKGCWNHHVCHPFAWIFAFLRTIPSRKLTNTVGHDKRKVVFQSSIFRCEPLVSAQTFPSHTSKRSRSIPSWYIGTLRGIMPSDEPKHDLPFCRHETRWYNVCWYPLDLTPPPRMQSSPPGWHDIFRLRDPDLNHKVSKIKNHLSQNSHFRAFFLPPFQRGKRI